MPDSQNCECPTEAKAPVVSENAKRILFARVTCPNCRVAESLMDKAGFAYEKVIADDNIELAKQYGVKSSPTLVITDGVNVEKYYGVPEIKSILASVQVR